MLSHPGDALVVALVDDGLCDPLSVPRQPVDVRPPGGDVGRLPADDGVEGARVQHHAVVEVRRVDGDVDLEELLEEAAAQREVEGRPLVVLADLPGKVGRVDPVRRAAVSGFTYDVFIYRVGLNLG